MKLRYVVDGRPVELDGEPGETLLVVLRRAGFVAVKEGCGVGDCGSCAVLVDGRARNSCITLAGQVEGAAIVTALGHGTPSAPGRLQRELVEAGGVQCGFCIPGFLAAAGSVAASKPRPVLRDFEAALDGHFCRCTGYVNQRRALEAATCPGGGGECQCEREKSGAFGAGASGVVGASLRKVDGLALACGTARFVEDELPPGTLVGGFLRSPHAHARIVSVDASAARALPGVVCVLTPDDVPRNVYTTAGQGSPEPSPHDTFVLDRKVRFVGDRVALVAAEDPEALRRALAAIVVEYEVLPAILDPARAQASGAVVIHDEAECHAALPIGYEPCRNLVSHAEALVGDPEGALSAAAVAVAGTFDTPVMHHASVEPHVCLAYLDENDRLVLRSSTQVPFHARRLTARALGLPVRRVRVVKPRVGGGFGGKQEVILEPLAGLLTLRTRRPVLMRFTREEEFVAGRTRHAQTVTGRVGVDGGGDLTAMTLDVLENTGAYGAHAHTVLCNAGSKTLPLYRAPNLSFRGDAVYTNLPVAGAFRGYGAPQAYFALECLIDEAAEELGMDPVEFRLRNVIRTGETSPIWELLGEGKPGMVHVLRSCGVEECLRRGAELAGWERRGALPRDGRFRRGLGMACVMEGASVPGVDMAAASIKMNDDGSFNLHMGATDIGQGSDTVLAQMAAQILGVDLDRILVLSSDTDVTPFDVGAYASSTTYLSGQAVVRAAEGVAEQIRRVAAVVLGCGPDGVELRGGEARGPGGRSVSLERVARRSLYEEDQHQIAAHASAASQASPPPFCAQFAQVEVDTRTGVVRVERFTAAVDCGVAVNPKLARGQMHGAVVQGLGYALTEEMLFDDRGRLLNGNLSEYPVLRMVDSPSVNVLLVETHEPTGPFGAKSVGEVGICGVLPAVANAVRHATGARLRRAPFTPERVLAALAEAGA